jgi:hypothetical protein
MRWKGMWNVGEESGNTYGVLVGKPEEKTLLGKNPGIDGSIILKRILKTGREGTDSMVLDGRNDEFF